MAPNVPADLLDLLERPLFGALGTLRADGTVQINPMWYEFDGEHIRFSHTSTRGKYRNLQRDPTMTMLITDPDDPERYLEVRGKLVCAVPDPTGAYHVHLGRRYGDPDVQPPADSPDRVILVMSVDKALGH
jgi:PPOX class probable F420-dependent enzyme